MNKIVLTAIVCGLLFACQQPTNKKITDKVVETEEKHKLQLVYSNLVDTESQQEVQQALAAAGVSTKNIGDFLESVALFNNTVGAKVGLVLQGYATIDSLLPHYDEAAIQSQWTHKYPIFQGYNCRITSFTLLRDFVAVATPTTRVSTDDEILFIDKEVLHTMPKKYFTAEDEARFWALFSSMPTKNTKEVASHLATVQHVWKERGISFPKKDDPMKASFISVLFHSQLSADENTLFVGHVGVLVPLKQGGILFVEKLAFQEPYQVIKFQNRTELSDYLMNRYDVEWDQPTAIPFIMENDALLEGYRANPYKKK